MAKLLNHIFENIAIEQLSRSEAISYCKYISEIFYQGLSVEQKVKYQRVKVRLNQRLIDLDKQEYKEKMEIIGLSTYFL